MATKNTTKKLKWTAEKLAAMKAARAAGKTWAEVGKMYGASEKMAWHLLSRPVYVDRLKESGVKAPKAKKAKSDKPTALMAAINAPLAAAKKSAPRKKK